MTSLVEAYRSNGLPPAAIAQSREQFIRFLHWEGSPQITAKRAFGAARWGRWLSDVHPLLSSVPLDRSRPSGVNVTDKFYYQYISDVQMHRLEIEARNIGVSRVFLLLSIYLAFLSRINGRAEIASVLLDDGRWHGDLRNIACCFVTPFVLNLTIREGESFGEFTKRISNLFIRRKAQPITRIDIDTVFGGRPTHIPWRLGNTAVNIVSGADWKNKLIDGVSFERFDSKYEVGVPYDLCVHFRPRPNGWQIAYDYNSGVINEASVVSWGHVMENFLARIIDGKDPAVLR
jgi:hypothetical protein